jgi:hypothetical protein
MPRSRVHDALRDRLMNQPPIPGWRVGRVALKCAIVCWPIIFLQQRGWSDTLTLSQAAGGIAITGSGNNFAGSLGSANAFGVGAPSSGVSEIAMTGGYLYASPVTLRVTGVNHASHFYAHLSTSSSSAIVVYSCAYAADCSQAANFTQLSTASPGALIASSVPSGGYRTVTIGIKVVAGLNGGSAVTGLLTPTIHFYSDDVSDTSYDECNLALSITIEKAIRLTLGAAGGLTPTSGTTTNYLMNFGSLNALGVGDPAAGLTEAVDANGCLYSTPYLISPSYASQSSSTATLKYWNSSTFGASTPLELRHSDQTGGSYSVMPTTQGTATTLSATSGTDITRRMAVYVKRGNGAGYAAGTYSAIVTYLLTAP